MRMAGPKKRNNTKGEGKYTMKVKELVCIGCPKGCSLQVAIRNKEIISIQGQHCKQGELYARKELTNPTRVVTATVRITGGQDSVVPVKTTFGIPKDSIFSCVEALKKIELKAPVHIGDIVIANVVETGVDIVITKNMKEI